MLLGVAAVLYLLPATTRQIWNQDEARQALLAQDTLRHGPRLPARVRDEPYLNKPPLFFWSIAAAGWLRGTVSDHAGSIPSVVGAVAALLAVFAIGTRLSGLSTGFVALGVLGTAPGFFLYSHEVLPDMMFGAWLTWALYFVVGALGEPEPRPAHLVGFYVCLAGALWTKGLPALMIVPATVAAVLISRGARHLLHFRPVTGLVLVALSALPWAIPYAQTPGGQRSQAVGITSSIVWYLDRFRHASSIPFGDGLLEFLPWTLWLIPAAVWWRHAPDRAAYRAVGAWMLVLLFLLGLSVQQRSRYFMPIYPLLALFVAASVTAPSSRPRALVRLNIVILAALVVAALALGGWLVLASGGEIRRAIFLPAGHGLRALLAGVAVAASVIALGELRAGRPEGRAVSWVAAGLACILFVAATTYPRRLADQYPVRTFAARAESALGPSAPLYAHPDANLSFDLYLGRTITELPARQAVASLLERPAASGLLLREADWTSWREVAHASWCPVARAVFGSHAFVFVGACR